MKFILILSALTVLSCTSKVPDPVPVQIFSTDAGSVRSYDFKTFEPLLKRSNDTVYVVNFWATWCAPCIKELPHFKSASNTYRDEKVRVLLVSLDMKRHVEESLLPFLDEYQINELAVHLHDPDADAWIPKVDSSWSGALPATLIYKNDKREFYEKSFTKQELESAIDSFLK